MKYLLLFLLTLVSYKSYSIDCPAGKVKRLQPEAGGKIHIFIEGQNWHHLGNSENPGVKEMLSVALSAHAQGKEVVLRFPDGYDCSAYNTTTPAHMIRVGD